MSQSPSTPNPIPQAFENSLQAPVVHPDAVEALNEQGWQILLSWIEEHAPQKVFKLAYAVNFFDYYQRQLAENQGRIDADTNSVVPEVLLSLVNRIGENGHW